MTFVLFSSNTTGVINGAGTANSNGVPEFVHSFSEVCLTLTVYLSSSLVLVGFVLLNL